MKKIIAKRRRKNTEEFPQFNGLSELVRSGARMMLQAAVEEELAAFLERSIYQRRAGQRGSRNGHKPRKINIGCGQVEIQMPQTRDTEMPFHSQLLPPYLTRMREVTEIIPLLYMNGLSTRKVKKAVAKLLGRQGLSHQNVARISGRIVEEFRQWRRRDLSELAVVYLFLDGIRMGVRAGTKEKEAVLVAWAFLEDGSRELLSVSLGNRESHASWQGFLEDLVKRGLSEPLLTVIDGCPGLNRAVREVFPDSDIQRCTKHKTENVLAKVLKEDHGEVKDSLRKIFYAPTYEHAQEAIEMFRRAWGKRYPSAWDILSNDLELCLTYYRYPYLHWRRIRTTNAIERTFREVRQRTRGIGRFKDEERALTMIYWQLKELPLVWCQHDA